MTLDIGAQKILPFEEKGFCDDACKGIRETIAKIQTRGVTAFTELAKGLSSDVCLFRIDGLENERCFGDEQV